MRTIEQEQSSIAMHGSIVMFLGLCAAIGLSVAATLNLETYGSWKFAHMEGVLNSLMVLAIAGVWSKIQASTAVTVAKWLLIVGAYCNIIGPLITAMFIGHRVIEPNTVLESIVVYCFYIPGCLPMVSFAIFIWGFYKASSSIS